MLMPEKTFFPYLWADNDSIPHQGAKSLNRIENYIIRVVNETIAAYEMFQPKDSVLIGVSGGPDSVALLYLLHKLADKLSLRIGIAHINHCLRQQDSDKDADFVASLADKFDLPFYIAKKDVYKYHIQKKLSIEEAAREIRYTFYYQIAGKNRFNKIALGHTCNDNAELVLMYMLRGSGPLGLSGIPPVRDSKKGYMIIRPLSGLTRSQILDFLTLNDIKYVIDKSNQDTEYLRNKIRHNLIPELKKIYNPKIIETLSRLANILRSENKWINDVVDPIFEKTISYVKDDVIALSVSLLKNTHIAAQRRIIRKAIERIKGNLKRITFLHIDSAIRLLENGQADKKIDLPDRIRIKRSNDFILFSKEKKALRTIKSTLSGKKIPSFEYEISADKNLLKNPEIIFIEKLNAHIKLSEISMENLPDFFEAGHLTAFFDMDRINFPMVIRNYRHGDRFRPLGMNGTQKIKKYFINNKVPKPKRARCPVLLSRTKIIWLVGYRIDDSVKVTSSTRIVLKVELFFI